MKIKKVNEELRQLSLEQLLERRENMQRELFSLRLSSATSQIKDYSVFKRLKRDIARIYTCIRERELA